MGRDKHSLREGVHTRDDPARPTKLPFFNNKNNNNNNNNNQKKRFRRSAIQFVMNTSALMRSLFQLCVAATFLMGVTLAAGQQPFDDLSQDPSAMNATMNNTMEGCYDMQVHKCDCTGLTKESCEESGGIFTAECACAAEIDVEAEEAGEGEEKRRRILLQQPVVGALQTGANAVTGAVTDAITTGNNDTTSSGEQDGAPSAENNSSSAATSNVTEQIPSGQGTINQPLPSGVGCLNETNQECNCTASVTQESCESTGGIYSDQCACTPDGPDQRQVYTNFTNAGDEIMTQEGRRRLTIYDLLL